MFARQDWLIPSKPVNAYSKIQSNLCSFTDTRLIRTVCFVSLGKENPYIFPKLNLPSIRILSMAPSVSVLKEVNRASSKQKRRHSGKTKVKQLTCDWIGFCSFGRKPISYTVSLINRPLAQLHSHLSLHSTAPLLWHHSR